MMKTEKRILSLLLCVLVLVTLLPRMQITSRAATVADLRYTISDEKVYITGCDTSASGELVIPAEIEGYPVTTISDRAFSLCASLTSITIPNSVTTIKPYVFMNDTGLTDITFCGSAPTFEIAPYDDGSYCFDNVTATAHYPCGDESWTDEVKQNYGGTITWEAAHTYENGICTGCGEVTILYSGTCGEEAYWTLDAAGKLTVSGTGEMEGYFSSADVPWYNYRSSIQTVEVCEGITSIGNCAFCDCTSLTDVTLPESIISIAAKAFCNCTSLTGVTIPEGVAFIEWATFRGCSSLTDVMLPESIISIEDEAFCNCISLTDVMLPESIISIEDEAFCNCISLTNVTIPESVTSIGLEAFACCSSLTSVTIPGGVTFFDWGVFRNCSSLTDVTISEGMTRIGDAAFFGCSSLTDVTIPDSVTVIGNYAFSDCTNLTSVTIPESVTTIEANAFTLCRSLTDVTIPSGITTIEAGMFTDCRSLTYVVIPAGVTDIEDDAFAFCTSLSSITFFGVAPSFGTRVFADVTATAYYPCGDETWTDIANQDYSGTITWEAAHTYENGICTGCGEVTILYSGTCGEEAYWTLDAAGKLTVSGTGEMEGYTSSADVTRYNYRSSITTYAPWYEYRSMITEVVIEDGISNVGDFAFQDCSNLTSVTIPEAVTEIGQSAFAGCISLTSVVIPDQVAVIDTAAFGGCTGLYSVTLSKNLTRIGDEAFSGCDNLTAIAIPDSVTAIGEYAFSYCESLAEITFGEGLLTIGEGAFIRCPVTAVTLPASVTKVGSCAFDRCGNLSSITFLGSAPTFVSNCFAEVTATAYYPCNDETWTDDVKQDYYGTITWEAVHRYDENNLCVYCQEVKIIASGNCGAPIDVYPGYADVWWRLDAAGKLTISGTGPVKDDVAGSFVPWSSNRGSIKTVEIGEGITRIGDRMFYRCSSLTGVTIPESVTSIGCCAFQDCSSLTDVIIPEGVSDIGDYAFYNCSSLTSIAIPESLTTIEYAVFKGCSSLVSVIIPESVTTIGTSAFSQCSSLSDVAIPESVTTIKSGAFYECSSLTSITIPEGVTSILWGLFHGCSSLTNVTIPKSVTFIDNDAFSQCSSLTSITIPEGVTSIGFDAVSYCTNLTSITFLGSAPSFQDRIFDDVTATAYYPCGDETWTDDVMQNYDGTITWEAAHSYEDGICTGCGAADPDYVEPVVTPTIALQYPTLVFEDVILMNVYFTASNLEDVVEMGLLTYTAETSAASVDTADAVIPGYAWSNTDRFYYATTNGIAAKDLGDEIYFAVYAKLADGTYTYTRVVSYSPAKYAYASLATGSAAMKPIVVAMLNYGAAAQSYFNYKTDALVNANLTAEQSALVESYRSDMITAVASPSDAKQGALTHNGGYTRRYPTVSFEGAFCINYYAIPAAAPADGITMYYWTQEDYDGAEVLTLENATAAIPMAGEGIGEYHAAVEGIAAKDLSKGVYVCFVYTSGSTTYYSGVLAYSIGSYCAAQAGGVATSAALAQATAVYGYYANELFN